MMKSLSLIGLLGLCVLFTSCGQKYPEAYGIYLTKGSAWIPIKPSADAIDIDAQPEFLVADSRLAHNGDKRSSAISISPVKWVRWNIRALVAKQNTEPAAYAKVKEDTFVQVEASRPLAFALIKKRQDMLLVTVPSALSDGHYWLSVFGERVLFRINQPASRDQLKPPHVLDQWDVVYDESAGFSWDAFLVASGAMQQNAKYYGPEKLDALVEALRQEVKDHDGDTDIVPFVALCKKVQHLDNDLYEHAMARCVTLIERVSRDAAARGDFPSAIGICCAATNANMVSESILATMSDATTKLADIEKNLAERSQRLEADRAGIGKTIATVNPFSGSHMFPGARFTMTITESHIEFGERGQNRVWLGYISNVRPVDGEDIRGTDYEVQLDERYGHDHSIVFDTKDQQMHCYSAMSNTLAKWKSERQEDLLLQVVARPHYWSERIVVNDLPYSMTRIDGADGVMLADVPLGASDEVVSRNQMQRSYKPGTTDFDMGQSFGNPAISGSFRVKSTGSSNVILRIRFCPATFAAEDAEQERLAMEAARKVIGEQAAKLLVGRWSCGSSSDRALAGRDFVTYRQDGSGVDAEDDSRPREFKWSLDVNMLTVAYSDNGESYTFRIEKIDDTELEMYGRSTTSLGSGGDFVKGLRRN